MVPSDDHVSTGFSFGKDGVGYHYNIRGKNGRSGGFDAAFRPGGETALLIGKFVLSIFQPETIPLLAEETEIEEAAVIIYNLAF
ncbi:hypothetical protein DMB65_15465 [Flavobacterium cheongpyeongense]|uniref:Uncharacterized protein n=1 Tax=Flavobacterium cheongpyeongense TaxID=2212651 RepID=A0A2V4C0Y6_9FLAO|nr:hypothetical protein [Flavobacterium cheongpyeongense]PXY39914.1 hypothetical protein DMB65_15465 [Flavobacterium cheongpyeongense]